MTADAYWLPYCTSDYKMPAARELAARLRANGEYLAVRVDRRPPDPDGTAYGKVFAKVAR